MKHWRITQVGAENSVPYYATAPTAQLALSKVEALTGPLASKFNNIQVRIVEVPELPEGVDAFTTY